MLVCFIAKLLPSYCRVGFFRFLRIAWKPEDIWCQGRDSNPRPPAYEVNDSNETKNKIIRVKSQSHKKPK